MSIISTRPPLWRSRRSLPASRVCRSRRAVRRRARRPAAPPLLCRRTSTSARAGARRAAPAPSAAAADAHRAARYPGAKLPAYLEGLGASLGPWPNPRAKPGPPRSPRAASRPRGGPGRRHTAVHVRDAPFLAAGERGGCAASHSGTGWSLVSRRPAGDATPRAWPRGHSRRTSCVGRPSARAAIALRLLRWGLPTSSAPNPRAASSDLLSSRSWQLRLRPAAPGRHQRVAAVVCGG